MFDTYYTLVLAPVKYGQTAGQALGMAEHGQAFHLAKLVVAINTDGDIRIIKDNKNRVGDVTLDELIDRIKAYLTV